MKEFDTPPLRREMCIAAKMVCYCPQVVFLRAEVLYTMGEFEQALVYFNRGRTQNPSEHKFVLGINKCREAITNCVGGQLQNKQCLLL